MMTPSMFLRSPKKGANFRDLPSVPVHLIINLDPYLPRVCVRSDNKVKWDPNVSRVYLPLHFYHFVMIAFVGEITSW